MWDAILLEANITRCGHKGMNTVSNNNQVDSVQMIRLYSICVNKPSNKCTKNVSSWCILQHLFMLGAVSIVPVCKHSNVQSKLYISSYLSFSSRCEVLEVGLFMIEQLSTASIAWPRSAQRRGRDDHTETANPLR